MADIKIVIGAEIKELEQKLDQAKTKLAALEATAIKGNSNIAASTKKVSEAFEGYGVKVQKIGDVSNKAGLGLSKLSDAATKSGDAAKIATSGLSDLGQEILSGGIVAGIGLAIIGLSKLSDALFGASTAQKAFSETIGEGAKGFAKATAEVSELTEEINLAKQGFLNKDDVVKHYNETIGKTTGLVKSIEEAEASLNARGQAYIRSMLLKTAATFAFTKSAEALTKAALGRAQGLDKLPGASDFIKDAEKESAAFLKLGNDFTKTKAFIDGQNGFNFFGDNEKAKQNKIKDVKYVADVLDDLIKKLTFLSEQEVALKTNEAAAKISAIKNSIQELYTKFNLTSKDSVIQDLFDKIKQFEQDLPGKIKNIKPVKIPVELTPKFLGTPDLKIEDSFLTDFQKEFEKSLEKKKPPTDQRGNTITIKVFPKLDLGPTKEFDEEIAKLQEDLYSSFAEGIGNSVAGGTSILKGALEGLLSILGDYLIKKGKILVQLGVLENIFLPGTGTKDIIAGVGEIALGAFAKAAKFATGTRSFGGTAIVGERGPELITLPQGSSVTPNAQLNAMGGGHGNIVAEYTIRGTDLHTVLRRTDALINRNG